MRRINKTTGFSTRKLLLLLAGLLVVAVLAQACGQKGDLILPDDAKAKQEKKKKERLF